jgi:hypothetical protein
MSDARGTESERLFEEYFNTNGHEGQFEHERQFEGKSKKPDYTLQWGDHALLFEVKQIEKARNVRPTKAKHINPYAPVREKINAARKKFREFEAYPCALVIRDLASGRVSGLGLHVVFGAMLGDTGLTFPVDLSGNGAAKPSPIHSVFLPHGGKMIDYKHQQLQNTRANSIIVIEEYYCRTDAPLQVKYDEACARREEELGRPLNREEQAIIHLELKLPDPKLWGARVPRVRIFENPGASKKLPRELFNGPYDERWSVDSGQTERVFAGPELLKIERATAPSDESLSW